MNFNLFLLIIKSLTNLAPVQTPSLMSVCPSLSPTLFLLCSFVHASASEPTNSSVCFKQSYGIFPLIGLFIVFKQLFKTHITIFWIVSYLDPSKCIMLSLLSMIFHHYMCCINIHIHTNTRKACLRFNPFFFYQLTCLLKKTMRDQVYKTIFKENTFIVLSRWQSQSPNLSSLLKRQTVNL